MNVQLRRCRENITSVDNWKKARWQGNCDPVISKVMTVGISALCVSEITYFRCKKKSCDSFVVFHSSWQKHHTKNA